MWRWRGGGGPSTDNVQAVFVRQRENRVAVPLKNSSTPTSPFNSSRARHATSSSKTTGGAATTAATATTRKHFTHVIRHEHDSSFACRLRRRVRDGAGEVIRDSDLPWPRAIPGGWGLEGSGVGGQHATELFVLH